MNAISVCYRPVYDQRFVDVAHHGGIPTGLDSCDLQFRFSVEHYCKSKAVDPVRTIDSRHIVS
jgi:hypothetical protein